MRKLTLTVEVVDGTLNIGSLINKIGFEQIKLSIIGKNLVTFTNYSGLDPEFADGGIYTLGYDGCSFPNPRSVSFGLSFTF